MKAINMLDRRQDAKQTKVEGGIACCPAHADKPPACIKGRYKIGEQSPLCCGNSVSGGPHGQ